MVQWLGLCASTAGGTGLIPDQGSKILQAAGWGHKKKVETSIGCVKIRRFVYL